jgi:hypothetical protein
MNAQVKLMGEKKSSEKDIRPMTRDEIISGKRPVLVMANGKHEGTYLEVRWSGAAKTWKTRPEDVDRPAKYGLYEHIRLGNVSGCPKLWPYTLAKTI